MDADHDAMHGMILLPLHSVVAPSDQNLLGCMMDYCTLFSPDNPAEVAQVIKVCYMYCEAEGYHITAFVLSMVVVVN